MSDDERLPVVADRAPPPPVKLARDFASREPREVVYVDNKGKGISRFRAEGQLFGFMGLVAILSIIGWLPWAPTIAVAVFYSWIWFQLRRQLRGNTLVLHGRLDEGEKIIAPLARSPFAFPVYRSLACSTMAGVELRRGNYEASLQWARRGQRWVLSRVSKSFCRMAEVTALVCLDRIAEARQVFDRRLRRVPRGDMLLHAYWQTQLYLWMAEGKHALDADELHRRARAALGVTTGRALLALLAWAHHVNGDIDQAWHLLREALAREDTEATDKVRGRLYAWIEQHKAEALAAAPPEDELAAQLSAGEAAT